ncbi:Aste57867_826 [Aphanomyces stellatus]|uniref:Aste57867_826 protein n=1 Tax=Aphanomyces stellatus TaxID=120398 RepID=A0A485K4T8_9STRA|nr:hypothetical protein As57867_000825 [Aphanomyces stellatus]VFT78050.1 Aste57867_826 [Aphanomyces stellatus]
MRPRIPPRRQVGPSQLHSRRHKEDLEPPREIRGQPPDQEAPPGAAAEAPTAGGDAEPRIDLVEGRRLADDEELSQAQNKALRHQIWQQSVLVRELHRWVACTTLREMGKEWILKQMYHNTDAVFQQHGYGASLIGDDECMKPESRRRVAMDSFTSHARMCAGGGASSLPIHHRSRGDSRVESWVHAASVPSVVWFDFGPASATNTFMWYLFLFSPACRHHVPIPLDEEAAIWGVDVDAFQNEVRGSGRFDPPSRWQRIKSELPPPREWPPSSLNPPSSAGRCWLRPDRWQTYESHVMFEMVGISLGE